MMRQFEVWVANSFLPIPRGSRAIVERGNNVPFSYYWGCYRLRKVLT